MRTRAVWTMTIIMWYLISAHFTHLTLGTSFLHILLLGWDSFYDLVRQDVTRDISECPVCTAMCLYVQSILFAGFRP